MPKRERIVLHVTDPSIYLNSGDELKAKHIIKCGSVYGRILFKYPDPLVQVISGPVKIHHCIFEDFTYLSTGLNIL